MRYLLLLPLTMLLSLASCRSDKYRIAEIVEEWHGKEIVFPEVMTDFHTGDTIDLSDADFTILTYIDSIGCTSCNLKLLQWKQLIKNIDSITDYTVTPVMVINSKDKKQITQEIKRFTYDHPIFLDLVDTVNQTNGFPDNKNYKTFLLDKNKRVIAIGNPLYLKGVKNLYRAILSGKVSTNHNSEIIVHNSIFKLGAVEPNKVIEKKITLCNHGNDTVFISDIISSCDCIKALDYPTILPPQKHTDIVFEIKTDADGDPSTKSINIFYKDFIYPSIIQIQ